MPACRCAALDRRSRRGRREARRASRSATSAGSGSATSSTSASSACSRRRRPAAAPARSRAWASCPGTGRSRSPRAGARRAACQRSRGATGSVPARGPRSVIAICQRAKLISPACYGRGRCRRRSRRSRPSGSRPSRASARLCHHSSSRNSLDTPDCARGPTAARPTRRTPGWPRRPSCVPCGGERVVPGLLLEHLRPGVEPGAAPPCALDHVAGPPSPRRQRALEHRGAHVVQGEPDLAASASPGACTSASPRAGRGSTCPPTGTACAAWARSWRR